MYVHKYSSEYGTGQSRNGEKPPITVQSCHLKWQKRRSIFSCSVKGSWYAWTTNHNKAAVMLGQSANHGITLYASQVSHIWRQLLEL